MIIDFSKDRALLTEDYLQAVGQWTKWLLGRMFGDDLKIGAKLQEDDPNENSKANFVIRGKYRDVKAYAQALGKERDYILAYSKYGKNHSHTVGAKAELDKATNHFERLTGIMWPFK